MAGYADAFITGGDYSYAGLFRGEGGGVSNRGILTTAVSQTSAPLALGVGADCQSYTFGGDSYGVDAYASAYYDSGSGTYGTAYGVYAEADSHASGENYGVFGVADDVAVAGKVWASSSSDIGVLGENLGNITADARGVVGISEPAPYYGIGGEFRGGYYGVKGEATISGSSSRYAGRFHAGGGDGMVYGVYATADDPENDGEARGIYASVSTSDGKAGWFSGDVEITGHISKSSGSFKIDHPLDPENKYLYHSFVESPDMMNVYNGNAVLDAGGEAWIELPEWFEALNREFRYQLTCIGGFAPVYVAEEVSGNRFQIAGGVPGGKVSWQVTGIRQDPFAEANRIPLEVEKRPEERGLYLHPEVHGLTRDSGIDYALHERAVIERELGSAAPTPARRDLPQRPERAQPEPRAPRQEDSRRAAERPSPSAAPKSAREMMEALGSPSRGHGGPRPEEEERRMERQPSPPTGLEPAREAAERGSRRAATLREGNGGPSSRLER